MIQCGILLCNQIAQNFFGSFAAIKAVCTNESLKVALCNIHDEYVAKMNSQD